MATKTEKLSEEIVNSIKTIQSDANNAIFDLGQISLRIRELNVQLKSVEDLKIKIEEKLDNKSLQLENILSDLQRKYKDANIDLETGTVEYEVSE